MPIAFCIVKYGKEMIEFLISKEDCIKNALTNWIQNNNLFEGEFAKRISKLGLINLLDYST